VTVLGLSAGNRDGSAEILLKAALRAAESDGAEVQLVRVDDLELSQGPHAAPDDGAWFWDRLMESEALIVSTPIYSRTVPGKLRLLGDKIAGPQADAGFTAEILRLRAAGQAVPVPFAVDERVLRPRVGGFIAVGGSEPAAWKTLALPLLHTLTFSMQLAVVDQVQFGGAGSPASITLDAGALARAGELGRHVAAQRGRAFDDAEYRGDPGACPLCHLDVIVLRPHGVECATCGAHGHFEVGEEGVAVVFGPEGRARSVLTMGEKLAHFREVQETAARQAPLRETIAERAAEFAAWDRVLRPSRAGATG